MRHILDGVISFSGENSIHDSGTADIGPQHYIVLFKASPEGLGSTVERRAFVGSRCNRSNIMNIAELAQGDKV